MIPASFDYLRAGSLDEALRLMAEHGPETKVIAGGQSLLPLMKLRLARPERLIDIGRVEELRGIREVAAGQAAGGGLAIGALTTYAELLEHPVVGSFGVMADVLPRIGDVQVRNRGTVGGAVAHADPASDLPAVLLALDAVVVVRSAARGERLVPIDGFFEGPFTTALAEDELLVELRIPPPSGAVGSAYQALDQPASGYPIAGVAAVVGGVTRIAVTGVGDHPYRATASEAALAGVLGPASGDPGADGPSVGAAIEAAIDAAVAQVVDGVTVNGDIHADSEYRAAMARVMAKRAIELARARLLG